MRCCPRLDAPAGDAAPHPDDVLELTEQMAANGEAETPSFQTIDGQADVIFTDRARPAGAAAPRGRGAAAAAGAAS